MTLQIREGSFYERRDGEKSGPMVSYMPEDDGLEWRDQKFDFTYYPNGTHCGNPTCQYDLVAEWPEPAPQEAGPVRTETVTTSTAVIQEGTYNDLYVAPMDQGWVHLELRAKGWRAHEIRKIVLHLNSLAEALESQP